MDVYQDKIKKFRETYDVAEEVADRIPSGHFKYIGEEIWNQAVAALLAGKNLLLVGEKSTGKNVLAGNLAEVFGRPLWDVSFHINVDASSLIGTDTLREGNVVFQAGPIYNCAKYGGFGVLDEINMAKNEAMAVLHSTLDFRRAIDVPGYDRIRLHDATRFIATMNYGYAGTRELNEALLSRFVVIDMPMIGEEQLKELIQGEFPEMIDEIAEQFAALFTDLKKKADSGEISNTALDIRGLLDSLDLISQGLSVDSALNMTIVNKSFDLFEKRLIQDVIKGRIPKGLEAKDVFRDGK